MYLPEIIKPLIDIRLQEICKNKKIAICPLEEDEKEITIICESVKFKDDDGNCWLEFTDINNKKYTVIGQGIDIYFEILL